MASSHAHASISDNVRTRNYLATELTITRVRWFIIAFLFSYLNVLKIPGYPLGLFNGLLAVAALYNLGIMIAVRKAWRYSVGLMLLSLGCDLTAVSIGVYFTDGIHSPLLFLWYLTLFKTGARFGFTRSLLIQVPLGLYYLYLFHRHPGISGIESASRLVFGLCSISAAALYGALFSREEQYTVKQLCDVHREAITDRLTGLYNYAYFLGELKREEARAGRSGSALALALFDIDHFKQVNDRYGHEKGNEVLRGVAEIIWSSARATDIVARYGGEEFVVLMPDSKGAEFEAAERIRQRVEEAAFTDSDGASFKITISAGVCSFPRQAVSMLELLDKADKGLYAAKHGGRNRTKRYDEDSAEPFRGFEYQPRSVKNNVVPFERVRHLSRTT